MNKKQEINNVPQVNPECKLEDAQLEKVAAGKILANNAATTYTTYTTTYVADPEKIKERLQPVVDVLKQTTTDV